jgi:hypothetical protein
VQDIYGNTIWDTTTEVFPLNLSVTTLDVTGSATVGGNLTVVGSASIGGNLTVAGSATLGGTSVSSLNDSGNATVGGTLGVAGAATLGSLVLGSPLGITYGGTGVASLPAGEVLIGNGTSAITGVAPGTSGNVLISNGSDWYSGVVSETGVTSGRNFTSVVTLPAPGTAILTAGQIGALVKNALGGAVTAAVLPAPSAVPGGVFAFVNEGNGQITITPTSGQFFMLDFPAGGGGSEATSDALVIQPMGSVELWSDGTYWVYGMNYVAGTTP